MAYRFLSKRKMKKKGISEVVITILMVGLAISITLIVWTVVNNLVKKNIQNTQSCFGNYGDVKINSQYTCYNSSSSPKEFYFAVELGDINVDKVTVQISSQGTAKSYAIPGTYRDAKPYGKSYGTALALPNKNEAVTYATNFSQTIPDSVKIFPTINGQLCDASDTLVNIEPC